jgi:hypothetical protein
VANTPCIHTYLGTYVILPTMVLLRKKGSAKRYCMYSVYIHMYIYMYVHMYIHMYVCMYCVHTYVCSFDTVPLDCFSFLKGEIHSCAFFYVQGSVMPFPIGFGYRQVAILLWLLGIAIIISPPYY